MTGFLRLNGWNVPGYGLAVSGGLEMHTEDLSGETSATDRVEKGVKPKTFSVSINICFENADDLAELIRKAEAKDEDGALIIYTITCREADVAGIRQVRFADAIRWKPFDRLRAWSVSFTLREYLSVPEKAEQREKGKQSVAQTSDGETVAPEENKKTDEARIASESSVLQEAAQTGFATLLRYVDKTLL